MRFRQLTWLRLLAISLVFLALPLWPGTVMAQEVITAQLDPVGDSGVSGTATLIAAGDGTNVELDIKGLTPGADARSAMHAGTCAMPSASFAALPNLKPDATGRATATGSVLFRGTEDVALATMADGEHIIAIQAGGQVVACGVIPNLTSGSAPPTLPVTGGAAFWLMAAIAGALGLCVLSGGLFLRQHSQPWRRLE
jgi:Cu/Zn superoxide dismutase